MAAADNSPKSGTIQANGFGVVTDPSVGKATQFKPGVSGNPLGKPKGSKHINTWVQEILSDEEFEAVLLDSKKGIVEYKGAPLVAILKAQVQMALNSKDESIKIKATDLLLKHGWTQKIEQENTGQQELIIKHVRS
jgi:hypothetical protein